MFTRKIMLCLCSLLLITAQVQAAVVLQYHHVSEDTPVATSVSPALFREHMAHIRESGYAVVPLEELSRRLEEGEPLPDKTVAVSFDDGFESIYRVAFPILKEYGWPFTVFVNTRPHDQGLSQFASWEQLREMAAAGATIANHTYSHLHMLRHLPGETDAQRLERIREEVSRADRTITREIGKPSRLFAYPYGEYDRATQGLLASMGFVAFGQQSGPLSARDHLQALPRFPFGGPYGTIEDFRTKLASLPMPLAAVDVYTGKQHLQDTILPSGETRPRLEIQLENESLARRVQCFASGQGAIPLRVEGAKVIAQVEKPLSVGRSRYNCTAASEQSGRFYWYSHVFIRKQANGEWYPEA
jgi:biofilm PGA synthesis lipoprotein PgaB